MKETEKDLKKVLQNLVDMRNKRLYANPSANVTLYDELIEEVSDKIERRG